MATSLSLRLTIYRQLDAERPGKRGLSPTNWIFLFLILLSLVLYTAETEKEIDFDQGIYRTLNVLILLAFGGEFILRLWAIGTVERYRGPSGALRYIRDNWFLMTVDFLAFAPALLLLAIGLNPPSWLRALRVARLFKMARYFPAFKLVIDGIRSCMHELLAALAVSVMLWYVASVLLYLAESGAQPDQFGSITRAMWWSVVTLTTVGYGDVYPVTICGKIFAGFIAILGVGAVAMPSGILAGSFMDKLRDGRRAPDDETAA